MKIENKLLYDMAKAVKDNYNRLGLYIEGYNGGVNIYATDGKALYRKNIIGNNQKEFAVRIGNTWTAKTGETDINELAKNGEKEREELIAKFRSYFDTDTFNHFTADCKEFKKTLKTVDTAIRDVKTDNRAVIISGNNGKIDIAAWTNAASVVCELEGDFNVTGALKIARKYFDIIKGNTLEFSFIAMSEKSNAIKINGDIEAIIAERTIEDKARFLEVMEYEYTRPIKPIEPIAEPIIEKRLDKPIKPRKERIVKKAMTRRTAKPKKENGAIHGWTWNRNKTRQIKVLNW